MIDKKLYIKSLCWEELLKLVSDLHEEFNVETNMYNDKLKTIQFTIDDKVFCEYEFDETHKRMFSPHC